MQTDLWRKMAHEASSRSDTIKRRGERTEENETHKCVQGASASANVVSLMNFACARVCSQMTVLCLSSSGVSWEQLGDKDRLFLVCKFEELMGHMQKEMHYNVSNEKDRAVVDTLAARAIASEPVLAVLEKSKKAGFDGVQVSCKIADSDGGENGAKPRRDGSPRRRNRSRSLSSARAGA